MKFGYFDDANREYVITTPKTPLPWINYLGCREFFTLISNTCGGYTFYKDAKLLRLTRYRYNDVPYDTNGKYFYIKDGDTVWNPGLAADQDGAGRLRVPPRHRLQPLHRLQERRAGICSHVCADGRQLRDLTG